MTKNEQERLQRGEVIVLASDTFVNGKLVESFRYDTHDGRFHGNCYICDQPLTINEHDGESGGYFSAHFFECVQPVKDGEYQVWDVDNDKPLAGHRYRHLRRAQHQAEYYSQWNPGRRFEARHV